MGTSEASLSTDGRADEHADEEADEADEDALLAEGMSAGGEVDG